METNVDIYNAKKDGYMALLSILLVTAKKLLRNDQNGPNARYTHNTWPPLSGIIHAISTVINAIGIDHRSGTKMSPINTSIGPPAAIAP